MCSLQVTKVSNIVIGIKYIPLFDQFIHELMHENNKGKQPLEEILTKHFFFELDDFEKDHHL
jgi:hypothetical protein